ncbi:MAG: tRNA (adenosine(37)-N6)-threonylcarbamoyltransferase complex ATPase subunit type 1 TsaE [Alistipes sp.]|nr:tRNA (adenosine(37)-N6)-threonylcarbamoyltransferase complex ATPase subunit type 1 TsaE [Alistipes sp.]
MEDLSVAAARLAPVLRERGGVVAMYGSMGAGKTTLVAALVRAMGSADDVSSPTFAIVNEYLVPAASGVLAVGLSDVGLSDVGATSDSGGGGAVDAVLDSGAGSVAAESIGQDVGGDENPAERGGESVFHFDFYRIEDPREAFDLGYEEYFYGGALCLVEWPEKVAELLPPDALRLSIEVQPDGSRLITLE